MVALNRKIENELLLHQSWHHQFIDTISDSCNAAEACLSAAYFDHALMILDESCSGYQACKYTVYYGHVEGISEQSCTGYQDYFKVPYNYEDFVTKINDCCNTEKVRECSYASEDAEVEKICPTKSKASKKK